MTELLSAEFTDETGPRRRLHREELLLYLTVIATAGSETTTRLIGWAGKTLASTRISARTRRTSQLIPQAIEGSCAGSRRRCRSRATSLATSITMGRRCPPGRRC